MGRPDGQGPWGFFKLPSCSFSNLKIRVRIQLSLQKIIEKRLGIELPILAKSRLQEFIKFLEQLKFTTFKNCCIAQKNWRLANLKNHCLR